MKAILIKRSSFSLNPIPSCPAGRSDWFRTGYNFFKGDTNTEPPAGDDAKIKEFNFGVAAALAQLGTEESNDVGQFAVNLGDDWAQQLFGAPLEIQYTTDTRVIWDNDVRDKIIYDKDDNPSGLFKDNKYAEIGFLSVFEKDCSGETTNFKEWQEIKGGKNQEGTYDFNAGVLLGQHYKRTGGADQKTFDKLRELVSGKKSVEKKIEKIEKKEENMSKTGSPTVTAATASTSVMDRAKDVIKSKGVVVARRTAARQINTTVQKVLIDKLLSTQSGNKRELDKLRNTLTTMFSTPFGLALCGILSGQAIPQVAKLVGQENNEHISAIAEECGIEGVVELANMLATMVREGAGELLTVVQQAIQAVPEEATA